MHCPYFSRRVWVRWPERGVALWTGYRCPHYTSLLFDATVEGRASRALVAYHPFCRRQRACLKGHVVVHAFVSPVCLIREWLLRDPLPWSFRCCLPTKRSQRLSRLCRVALVLLACASTGVFMWSVMRACAKRRRRALEQDAGASRTSDGSMQVRQILILTAARNRTRAVKPLRFSMFRCWLHLEPFASMVSFWREFNSIHLLWDTGWARASGTTRS